MTSTALRPHRGHLARYSLWQFRDYVLEKGVGTYLVGILAGYLSLMLVRQQIDRGGHLPPEVYPLVLQQLLSNLVFVGALFAGNGIVSDDRKNGFFRFYFAKPVNVPWFYLQKLLVSFAGFMLVTLLLVPLWMRFFAQPAPPWTLYVGAAAGFILYAGLGFLLSAFVRTDWLSFIGLYLVSKVAWMSLGHRTDVVGKLVHLLPPVGSGQIDRVDAAAVSGTLDWTLIAWVAGYGVGAVLLGLVALRRRALAGGA